MPQPQPVPMPQPMPLPLPLPLPLPMPLPLPGPMPQPLPFPQVTRITSWMEVNPSSTLRMPSRRKVGTFRSRSTCLY